MQPATMIRCSRCGQSINVHVTTYVDVQQNPNAKVALLSGQLNQVQCPNCGTLNAIAAPLLYHDADKELLVAYVPMELNLNKDGQERAIGDLMKALPKENFKGYMFSPKRALTMQGLTELILQADGVTPEMMEQQKARIELVQQLVEAPDEQLAALIEAHDSEIDLQFMQTLALMAQRMAEAGRPDIAQQIVLTQSFIMELSSFGQEMQQRQLEQEQVVKEIADRINALGETAQRSDFLALAREFQDDEARLQALVGLVRPVFDQQFFQEMTLTIGQAPAAEREGLEALRQQLMQLTTMIDQQQQQQVQQAARLLQALLNTPDLDTALRENIIAIDDTFMAVLSANIQEMQRRQDPQAVAALQRIYEHVVAILQENMQPELVFVNELLSAETPEAARQLLNEQARAYGEPLLDVMDAVEQVLSQQGEAEMVERLNELRREAAVVLNG